MPETTKPQNVQPDYPRLPCRGCTADCSNYLMCEGKPWRMIKREASRPVQKETPAAD
jgi:hypothetical protein